MELIYMEPIYIVLIVIASIIGAALLFLFLPPFLISIHVYRDILVRTSKKKWGRECSMKSDKEQVEMYRRGEEWGERFKDKMQDVSITSDGFKLYGEYFDFGCKRAVIVIPGRMEACNYAYYFAKPYQENGFNVLVIDNRCHGYSEGTHPALGTKEYRDILAWGKLIHEKFGNEKVVLHAICIGSATALYAMTSDRCPDYMAGMVADGMYTTFCESFKNHLIKDKRPVFPFNSFVMFLLKVRSGTNPVTDGPIYRMDKMNKPILFLYSKLDEFSKPEQAEALFKACKAPKRIQWFDKGCHSHIRINDEDGYDKTVKQFCNDYFNE